MDAMDVFALFSRWVHVASAVAAVGGTLAMRFVILPALEAHPVGQETMGAIRAGFKRFIHSAIGLLLLTGLYNYVIIAIPAVRRVKDAGGHAAEVIARYHMVMGVKIALSLGLFVIAIMLLLPVPAMHENRKTWLSVNVVLGLLILLLGAYLRRLWPVPLMSGE